MKNIRLLIFSLLLFNSAYSQYFRITNDTTLLYNSELVLRNSTKNKAGAFIRNKGNGITDFAYAVDSIYTGHDTMFFHRGDGWSFMKIPSGYTDVAARAANANLYPSLSVGYVNPPWITSLPASKITGLPAGVGPNSGTVEELRAMATTTGNIYFSTDRGAGTWVDEGLNDGGAIDDGAIYIVTANGHRLHRQVNGEVYPEWWGAVADDGLSDRQAFAAAVAFCQSNNKNLRVDPNGVYNLVGTSTSLPALIIPGRTSNGSAMKIIGGGSRSTTLLGSNCSLVVQLGTTTNDFLNGVFTGFKIEADSTINGINIVSNAPTSGAFNTVSDLYLKNTKDALKLVGSAVNPSSNYANYFDGIRVERYWGIGMSVSGVYNSFKNCFIVAPNGTTRGKGANTLSLLVEGSDNSFEKFQTEDQINIVGNNNHLTASAIEFIIKDVANSDIGSVGIRISGTGNSVDGLTMQGFNKNVFTTIGSIYGTYTTLRNVSYNNLSNPLYDVLYPILPAGGSSGTMDNVTNSPLPGNVNVFYPDNTSFLSNYADWSLRNVLGSTGLFSRDNHLTINEADPTALPKAGGTATGFINLTAGALLGTNSVIDGSLYNRSDAQFGYNKLSNGYLAYVARDITGPEAVWNYSYVGTINNNGNETNFGGAATVPSLNVKFGAGAPSVAKIVPNGIDGNNGGPTLQYKSLGTFYDGFRLNQSGKGWFANTVSGAAASLDSEYVPLSQLKSLVSDTVRQREALNQFTLRNAGGTGDTIMNASKEANTAVYKRISVTGSGVVKTVTDTTINYAITGGNVTGALSFTADGSTTAFTFVTTSIPSYTIDSNVFLTITSATGSPIEWVEKSTESFIVHFSTAPTSGTKTLNYLIVP